MLESDGQSSEDSGPTSAEALQLNRKDLNLGAGLMYLGSLFALFVGVFYGGAHNNQNIFDAMFALPSAIMWYFLTNTGAFVALLLGLRFSSRQKDMSLGAMLMFLLSILSGFVVAMPALGLELDTVGTYGKAELIALTLSLATILLFGKPLMQQLLRGLFRLFATEPAMVNLTESIASKDNASLPPSLDELLSPSVNPEGETREMIASVVDEPTRRFESETKPLPK